MHGEEQTVSHTLKRFHHFRYALVLEGVAVGILAGVVVVVFRILLEKAAELLNLALAYGHSHPWFIPVWFVILLMAALVVALLLRWEPYISGSGIPQVEGEMQGEIKETWWRVLLAKYIGGILSIGCGLSLGREGPSIQLGAMTAKGFSRLTGRMRTEEKLLITCGASAGLSAAFNAPIAGVLFSLEEIHKNFSPLALVTVMVASLTGDFISKNIFGMTPSLYFPLVESLPLGQYGFLIILGIIAGLLGVLYNKTTMFTLKLYDKITFLKNNQKIYIPLIISIGFMIFYPDVLCGG